ncbi:unnamed protein product [Meganyctiphanes norvegica]|uniref:Ileal sodium/bile acid cotransporter n=1 Tax=Meganyctiphanes norvegica TaxID=48144 RepID=A0AAV2Q5E4_MEGNR
MCAFLTAAAGSSEEEITEYDPTHLNTDTDLNITQTNSSTPSNYGLNSHNATGPPKMIPQWRTILDKTATILMICNTINMMLAMGAATSWKEVWQHSRNPLRAIIGMVGQFILLPALGVCLSLAFSLTAAEAIGVLMVSCSPGGTASNFFTYWVDGDLALSIVMTTWSSALSVGAMPLNIWIYSRIWIDSASGIVIPYNSIMIGLMFVIIPSALGMVVRHFKEKIANIIVKVCSFLGWLGFVVCLIIWLVLYWSLFVNATPLLWLAAVLLPCAGFCLSYGFSLAVKQNQVIARTIGIETGSQNMAVALNIILLSFPEPEIKSAMLVYPTLFGFMLYIQVFIFIGVFQLYKHCHQHHQVSITKDENGKAVDIKTTIN